MGAWNDLSRVVEQTDFKVKVYECRQRSSGLSTGRAIDSVNMYTTTAQRGTRRFRIELFFLEPVAPCVGNAFSVEQIRMTCSYQAHERRSHASRDRWKISLANRQATLALVWAFDRVGDAGRELVEELSRVDDRRVSAGVKMWEEIVNSISKD